MANPNWLQELLLNQVIPVLENLGESYLVQTLQKEHDKNPKVFKEKITILHSGLSWIRPSIIESKTKIDDGIVTTLIEAVETVASNNGIVL